jgi:hypothetical protein
MKKSLPSLLIAGFVISAFVMAASGQISKKVVGNEPAPSTNFAAANVHFEQNATDGDVEVVFEVKGGDEGLARLTVVSPDGRTVIDFEAPDASTLGMRQFIFESPEPRDVQSLKSAYPEGRYIFTGVTASGHKLHGESVLSHKLPDTPTFLHPPANAQGVSTKNLEITSTPVKNLAAYIVYIEQDAQNVSITARLSGPIASFVVPDGFLFSGTEYQLGIGTVGDNGNISFIETTFTTAEKE